MLTNFEAKQSPIAIAYRDGVEEKKQRLVSANDALMNQGQDREREIRVEMDSEL